MMNSSLLRYACPPRDSPPGTSYTQYVRAMVKGNSLLSSITDKLPRLSRILPSGIIRALFFLLSLTVYLLCANIRFFIVSNANVAYILVIFCDAVSDETYSATFGIVRYLACQLFYAASSCGCNSCINFFYGGTALVAFDEEFVCGDNLCALCVEMLAKRQV